MVSRGKRLKKTVQTVATFLPLTIFPECLLCARTVPGAADDMGMSQMSSPTELLSYLEREIPGGTHEG